MNRIILYNLNWSTLLFPMVKNKIIIDYNRYIDDLNGLVSTLETFLDLKLRIDYNNKVDNLYSNPQSKDWKNILEPKIIDKISRKFEPVQKYIESLMKDQ